jgi:ABC-type multidrug transport system fused ATPase/permease subunit
MGISIQNVCFAYEGDYSKEDGALHNFSLEIDPGKKIALVGPSGAGKTTIRKIVTRLVDCQKGTVLVGGVDIKDWDGHQLLEQFSYVPQGDDVYIFDESIRYNIAFPRPEAGDEEVIQAAKLAGIHDFILNLKDGYDTQVGERGIRLSGGQKQRVALSRAILADRPILILDEATSAVDAITESEIQTNMRTILTGKTAIIIAHRLSTVWGLADKIVVMDNGEKVEEGTHKELVDQNGLYARMVSLQTE